MLSPATSLPDSSTLQGTFVAVMDHRYYWCRIVGSGAFLTAPQREGLAELMTLCERLYPDLSPEVASAYVQARAKFEEGRT